MAEKKNRQTLLIAQFLLAISGLFLHVRIHPFLAAPPGNPTGPLVFRGAFAAATILPLLDVVVVTSFFCSKRTAVYGFLLNGLIVIYGSVLMAHFSISKLIVQAAPPSAWILKSTLPDIGLAWADFFVGKALYSAWINEA